MLCLKLGQRRLTLRSCTLVRQILVEYSNIPKPTWPSGAYPPPGSVPPPNLYPKCCCKPTVKYPSCCQRPDCQCNPCCQNPVNQCTPCCQNPDYRCTPCCQNPECQCTQYCQSTGYQCPPCCRSTEYYLPPQPGFEYPSGCFQCCSGSPCCSRCQCCCSRPQCCCSRSQCCSPPGTPEMHFCKNGTAQFACPGEGSGTRTVIGNFETMLTANQRDIYRSLYNCSNCSKECCRPPKCCYPGPVPYNPCCPHFPKANFKRYRSIFFFVSIPLIVLAAFNAFGNEHCPKGSCREFEYMRRRTKRFPWGNGNESFLHNPHTNHLPEECEPPPLICYPDPNG